MGINAIKNYMRVSDRIASSGQPEGRQFEAIADAGYQVVINLAMPDTDNAIPEEGNIVVAHRMRCVHVPVPFDAPTAGHLREFIGAMAEFADQKVWVHCALNYRVSAFLYQYQRLVHGVSPEEAAAAMRPSWQSDDVWRRFMSISAEELGL